MRTFDLVIEARNCRSDCVKLFNMKLNQKIEDLNNNVLFFNCFHQVTRAELQGQRKEGSFLI